MIHGIRACHEEHPRLNKSAFLIRVITVLLDIPLRSSSCSGACRRVSESNAPRTHVPTNKQKGRKLASPAFHVLLLSGVYPLLRHFVRLVMKFDKTLVVDTAGAAGTTGAVAAINAVDGNSFCARPCTPDNSFEPSAKAAEIDVSASLTTATNLGK